MSGAALVADVGGTHTRLALAQDGSLGDVAHYLNADTDGLEQLIEDYLAKRGVQAAKLAACLALAAPVENEPVVLTNLDWTLSADALRARFGFRAVEFVNDFAALAFSLPALGAKDSVALGAGRADPQAPALVLGPGTGLGAALCVPAVSGICVVATEAGHVTLAANDDAEAAVIARLRASRGRVSAERVLSGPGLVALYRVFGGNADDVDPAAVVARALDAREKSASEALAAFFRFLGGFAGDLALATGARGGVFLAGGILPRLLEPLTGSAFRSAFEAKGRFSDYVARIPTRVIVHPDPALLGLAALMRDP